MNFKHYIRTFASTLILAVIPLGAFAQTPASEEAVKAAFIYHFISFTEWEDPGSNYYVCIPDDENLRRTSQQMLKGKMVNGRQVKVVERSNVCHILVSDRVPYTDSTLTVGSLANGALLEFRIVDRKLKFAVNLEQLKKSKLKISSQLLKLAIIGS